MKPGLFLLALKTMVVADQIAWNKYMNTLRLHDAGGSGDGSVAQLDQRYLDNVKRFVNRANLRKMYRFKVKRVECNCHKQHHRRTKESRGKKDIHYFSLVF